MYRALRRFGSIVRTTERVECDVLIVGGGPAGLSAGIRLKQLTPGLSVVLLDKSAEIGASYFSPMIFDPRGLDELLPNWSTSGLNLGPPVTKTSAKLLTENGHLDISRFGRGYILNNEGNYIADMGVLTRWLKNQAEELGVHVYPGFSGSEVLYNELGVVRGVITGAFTIEHDDPQPQLEIQAR
jgi:electron-transferring-flavoprotein dehydrogenase